MNMTCMAGFINSANAHKTDGFPKAVDRHGEKLVDKMNATFRYIDKDNIWAAFATRHSMMMVTQQRY